MVDSLYWEGGEDVDGGHCRVAYEGELDPVDVENNGVWSVCPQLTEALLKLMKRPLKG